MTIRSRLNDILEVADPDDRVSRLFDFSMMALILLNVIAAALGTVNAVEATYGPWLDLFERFSVAVFTVEYVLRLWCAPTEPGFAGAIVGRLRFALTPLALIDLLAVAPYYVDLFLETTGGEARTLRAVRLVRVFRFGRYSRVLRTFARVLRDKRDELVMTVVFMAVLLLLAATLIYVAEKDAQPKHFSSIPAAMWWGVTTLTTVGYGDVYPVTTMGRVLAAVIAILGIGMFALPTSILGAGFVEKLEESRRPRQRGDTRRGDRCPHCGKSLDDAADPAHGDAST